MNLKIDLCCHGLKSAKTIEGRYVLPLGDCYIDCRGVPNPAYAKVTLGTGDDSLTRIWIRGQLGPWALSAFMDQVRGSIKHLKTRRGEKWHDKPFTIVCLCAHGIHRSRAMMHILAGELVKDHTVFIDGVGAVTACPSIKGVR